MALTRLPLECHAYSRSAERHTIVPVLLGVQDNGCYKDIVIIPTMNIISLYLVCN